MKQNDNLSLSSWGGFGEALEVHGILFWFISLLLWDKGVFSDCFCCFGSSVF